MPALEKIRANRQGFSLIELALVLGISGLMLGFVLQSKQSAAVADCYAATKLQLRDIDGAIQRFSRQRERLPLPAARNVGVEAVTYGREASGGAIDAAGGASWGALPFQALGLAPSYASDCWGNKLTYVVTTALTTSATVGGYLDSSVLGNITVRKDASTNSSTTAAYAVISHGEDALGAVKNNYSSGAKGWCTGASTLTTQNCLANAATVASAVFNDGRDAGAAYFDDVIITNGRPLIAGSNVLCWGLNSGADLSGALGDGTTTDRYFPGRVNSTALFTTLFSGANSSISAGAFCALTDDGTAYCWGNNANANLGSTSCSPSCVGSPVPAFYSTPTLVPGGFKFKTLSMNGTATTCGIVAAGGNGTPGEIRCWGNHTENSLGNNSLAQSRNYGTPQLVGGPAATMAFSKLYNLGSRSGCALTAGSGEAWCWGRSSEGQIGNGVYVGNPNPTLAAGGQTFSKLKWISSTAVCGLTKGNTSRGRVICWGASGNGQLGRGSLGSGNGYTSAPTVSFGDITGSGAAATARVENGQVVGVTVTAGGSNYTAQPNVIFTGGGGVNAAASAVVSGGTIVAVQVRNATPAAQEVAGGHEFVEFSSGNHNSNSTVCGLKADGQAFCWGNNANGVGGAGTSSTASGYGYTVAPTVHFVAGSGTGAAGTAVLGSGGVVSITMTSGGSGYATTPGTIVFNGGDGYGVAGRDVFTGGPITSFTITNPGSGYTSPPTVTVNPTNATIAGQIAPSPDPFPPGTCTSTINVGLGTVTGITCSSYGDFITSAAVTFSGGGGTGAAATANINPDRIVAARVTLNNANILTPTAIGGALRFVSIGTQSGAMLGIGTDNRLYSWGSNNGSQFNLGVAGGPFNVPTLINSFLRNSATGAGDTTAAGISFTRECGSFCALDDQGRSYRWRADVGNGQIGSFSRPSATCPTTPTAPAPACNFRWTQQALAGASNSVCGIEDNPTLNCAAQTVNWGACTQTIRATVNGEELVLYDMTPADRGSITATCNKGALVLSDGECGGVACTADGASSGGNPANCCNGDSDGNGTCGTQVGGCGPTDDSGSCTGFSCNICCNGTAATCANGTGGDVPLTFGAGCDGSLCPVPTSCAPTQCSNNTIGGTGNLESAACSGCTDNGITVKTIGIGCQQHRCDNGTWTNLGSGAPCPVASACY